MVLINCSKPVLECFKNASKSLSSWQTLIFLEAVVIAVENEVHYTIEH